MSFSDLEICGAFIRLSRDNLLKPVTIFLCVFTFVVGQKAYRMLLEFEFKFKGSLQVTHLFFRLLLTCSVVLNSVYPEELAVELFL